MSSKSLMLTVCLALGCALPPTAELAAQQRDDQRYVAADGTVSRRLDLRDEDDRRLLASLIMQGEGRVYAFERIPKGLGGRKSQQGTSAPQVFDLTKRHDADRLAAAISGGRSMFFVARSLRSAPDDAVTSASSAPDLDIDSNPPARKAPEPRVRQAGTTKLTAEQVDRYTVEGRIGRRVDLYDPSERHRLSAMITERAGRIFSFEKGDAITGKPETFDLAESRDADRLAGQISSGRHVFFVVDDEGRDESGSTIAKAGATIERTGPATMPAPERDGITVAQKETQGRGGPIQLFPRDEASDALPVIAASETAQSDVQPTILEFIDEPLDKADAADTPDDSTEPKPVLIPKSDPAVTSEAGPARTFAALTDPIEMPEPTTAPKPIATPHNPTPPRPFIPAETKAPVPEAPKDEAEVIAALERERQIGSQPAAGSAPKIVTKKQGAVIPVDAPKQTLDLAVGEGQLVRLPEPIAKMLIADPSIADAQVMSDDLIYIFGNKLGQTNIFGLTADERISADFDIRIGNNVAGARARLRELQPDTMADYTHVGGQVVAQGLVRDPNEAYQVAALGDAITDQGLPAINNTVIPGAQQVNIRVRFAEVSRTDIARLGINWQAILDSGDFLFGLTSGNLFLPDGGGGVDSTESFSTLFGNGTFGDFSLDIFLEGLEREGIVNVLAEPNLTAINGQPANFLAGGEIPIPVPQSDDIITIDYKPFGVSLEFLPTLVPGDRINLQVRPEVSSIISNGGVVLEGFNIPAFSVRRAETAIELASGQTFAIAGLFQRSVSSDVDKFPVIGDVPVIGALFQSPRFQRAETELVILITPYLVQPTPSATVTVPNQRVDQSIPPVKPRQPSSGLGGFIID